MFFLWLFFFFFFFFNDTATTEIYTLSLHDALPIRPWYKRSPSQTASPPCTAESNGLTAASLRWVRRPPTLTMTSRLRSSKAWSMIPPLSLPPSRDVVPEARRTAARLVVPEARKSAEWEARGLQSLVAGAAS